MDFTPESSEEEEDMANCLIMLAHSVSPINEDKTDIDFQKTEKLKIRSVTEMAGAGAGENSGYECKTCNRAFPSFQALGGHRASHKKPKLTADEESQPKLLVVYSSPATPDNMRNSTQTGYKNCQTKVHQCSICGSEFLSGQALGGHMRRHRTAPPPSISPNKAKPSPEDASGHHIIEKSHVLSLDLNLPPPEVVDVDGHSNFQFPASSSQQRPLVFSAAALVDCHY